MPNVGTLLNNPLESRLGYQLRRASAVMMADLAERLAPLGLTPTEASVLVLIDANPGTTQTEIGRALAIKRANMVPLIASLMDRRLVVREAVDGRSHALLVAEAGHCAAQASLQIMAKHERRFLGDLSSREASTWRERLHIIWADD